MSLKLNMNLKFIVCTLSFTHSSLCETIYVYSNHMQNVPNLYHPITATPAIHVGTQMHYELASFSVEYNFHLHN